jgi:hypothetical protein
MLFDISFRADCKQIGEYRQGQTDHSNRCEHSKCVHYNYKVGDKILIKKYSILCKAESIWKIQPWALTAVHYMELSGFKAKPNQKE